MNNSNVSALIDVEELQKATEIEEEMARLCSKKTLESVRIKALEVLSLLSMSHEFTQLFMAHSVEDLNAFVFTYKSTRTVILDMVARCPRDQLVNFETYKFASHPEFEKKITQYTRTPEKPNNQLAKCRSWDVALNLIVKIEALDNEEMKKPSMRLLFREHQILKIIWDYYMREKMELDEMTGIPIMFYYKELPNAIYNYDSSEYKVFDQYGHLVPWKSENRSTLSYLCLEKMGPNVQYLMDVMSASKRRNCCVFNFDTAFKLFDQLLCRCLQLHRFGVVHNSVEPSNLFFGRSTAFNVLYILNFNAAVAFDPKDLGHRRNQQSENKLYGTLRFASHMRQKGMQSHPVFDLESAFYTLLAMLTNNLPWDRLLHTTAWNASLLMQSPMRFSNVALRLSLRRNSSNQYDPSKKFIENAKSVIQDGKLHKVIDFKANFWRSPSGIARVLSDLQYMAADSDRNRVILATEIIKELYSKIRELLNTMGSNAPSASFFSNLLMQHTNEFQIYTDLRRAVLMLYRFESISAVITTPTYQKKLESLAHEDSEVGMRIAWNLTNWCFNSVDVCIDSMPRRDRFPDAWVRSIE